MHKLLPIPEVIARRPYDVNNPDGYISDRDFLENNLDACLWFLENVSKIEEILHQIEQL